MNEQIQPSKGAPLFNPWSPEFIANPYPSYHLLRETEPMHYMPLGLYVASRHADVTTILRDKRFGKDFIGRIEDMRPRIQAIVDGIINHVEPRGHMDLIADFAYRLPVTVICDMLGIPEGDREIFHAGSRTGGRLLDLGPLSPAEIQQQNPR